MKQRIVGVLKKFDQQHPLLSAFLCFLGALTLLLILIWFLLFSGLNTSADFVYNQF